MKILVDEMPEVAEECIFATTFTKCCNLTTFACFLNKESVCPFLKEYKPVEDDCK